MFTSHSNEGTENNLAWARVSRDKQLKEEFLPSVKELTNPDAKELLLGINTDILNRMDGC